MLRPLTSLLLIVGAVACAAAPAPAAPVLLGQWPLDGSYEDGASQATADVSGNGLSLTAPIGAVHLGAPARFGTGATLATNLTPMKVTSPLLAPARLTLLAWVKQSGNPGTLHYLAGRGDDGLTCGGSSYALYTGYPGKGGLRFYVRFGGVGDSALTDAPADAAVFDGQWHLVAGTYDGVAARLYVDGTLVGSPVPAPAPLAYALGGGSSFYVDGYAVEGCSLSANADDWPGAIDEVRLYDQPLTSDELGRLAAASGPSAPSLTTEAAPVPAAVPAPAPAPAPAPIPGTTPPVLLVPKAIPGSSLEQAAAGVKGATKQAPDAAIKAALAAIQAQALETMRKAGGASQVAAPQPAKDLTAKQAKQIQASDRLQDRLEAMKYGLTAQVPTAAPGQVVEAVATIAVEKKRDGKVTTQTIVLPPAVGVAEAGARQAQVTFPVDGKATAAMTKEDVAKAAMAVQATTTDSLGDLSQELQLRLQTLMDQRSKAAATLSNVMAKLSQTEHAITQNIKGGVTGSERQEQKALTEKAAKLDKQAKAIERQRDEANQKASQAMQEAVTNLVAGIAAGTAQAGGGIGGKTLPAASTSLSGCSRCPYAAGLEASSR